MRRTMLAALAITAATTALASCSSSPAPKTIAASTPTPASTSGAATVAPSAAPQDAATVTGKLASVIPSVKLTVTYDATSDPNGRLGRPHQYTSKTAFDDTRVSGTEKAKEDATQDRRDSISYGGTVEVFATATDATAWVKYVDTAQQALGGLLKPDYLYQHGQVVVRVSHLLTPDQAAAYDRAIS